MKRGILYTLLFATLVSLQYEKVFARQSATAVMEVRVEVLPAANVITHLENITSQLQDPDENGESIISLGTYNVTVPDGASYLLSSEKSVTMSGTEGVMFVELDVRKSRKKDGSADFFLSGVVDTSGATDGLYVGEQKTRIEYD